MSLGHSPSIVSNGLVLYYDMNNTKKSFIGPPVTNLAKNSDTTRAWSVASLARTITETTVIANEKYRITAPAGTPSVGSGDFRMYFPFGNLVNGTIYTLSMKYKVISGGATTSTGSISFSDWNDAPIGTIYDIVYPTYNYLYVTANAFTGYSSTYHFMDMMVSANATVVDIWDLQLEAGTFPTTYTTYQRTNTQSLKDLTNTNTITASSLTYASDNTFSFNGTTDYIDCGSSPSIKPTSALTVSTWIKFSALVANNRVLSDWHQLGDTADRWIFYITSTTTIQWYIHTIGTTDVGISYNPALNTWINLVGTYDGSVMYLYANGILVSQAAKTGSMSAGAGFTVRIGRQAETGSSHNGYISTTQIYNRALSASEVLQNFNALKGRYGL